MAYGDTPLLQPYDPAALGAQILQTIGVRPNAPQVFTSGGRAVAPAYNDAGGAVVPMQGGQGRPGTTAASPYSIALAQGLMAGSSKTAMAAAQLGQDQEALSQIQQAGTNPTHGTWGSFATNMLADMLQSGNLKRDQQAYLTSALADRTNAAARAQSAADAAAGGGQAATSPAQPPTSSPAAEAAPVDDSLAGHLSRAWDALLGEDDTASTAGANAGTPPTGQGLPVESGADTSPSGTPLQVGGQSPGPNAGVPVGASPSTVASGASNPASDIGTDTHLLAALMQGNAPAAQPSDHNLALAAAMSGNTPPASQASASGTSPDPQALAALLNPSTAAPQSAGQNPAAMASSGQPGIQGGGLPFSPGVPAAGSAPGQAAPMQLAAAQGQPPPYGQPGASGFPAAGLGAGDASAAAVSPAAQAYSFFTGRGYTPAAAAGLVGNLQAESGLNAGAFNASERAGGIAQWRGARLDGLKAFAASTGGTPNDLNTQLAYMDHELRTSEGHAGALLQSASDPTSAAAAATAYFRPAGYRPGGDPSQVAGWQTRSGAALAAMNAFGIQGVQAQQQAMLASRGLPTGSYQQAQLDGTSPAPAYGNPQAAPQGQGAPAMMYGPAENARERAVIGALIGSPDPGQRAQAMQMLQDIQQRELSPIKQDAHYDQSTNQTTYTPVTAGEGRVVTVDGSGNVVPWRAPLPAGMAYDTNGVVHPIAGTGYTDVQGGPPGTVLQRGPNGELKAVSIPNASGGAPTGTVWNGQSYAPAPGASYGPPQRLAGTDLVGQTAPDGSIKSVGSVSLGPKDLQSIQNGYASSEEGKNYSEALAARRAMGVAAQQANGAGDYAMLDTYARAINPGAVARLGTIEAIKESRDVPAQVQAEIQHWGPNGGTLSPASRQQLLNVTNAFVNSRWQALQPRLQDAYGFAQRNNLDPRSVVPSFDPPSSTGGGGGQNQAAVLAAARAAIQQGAPRAAVLQRLQRMNVPTGGL